MPPLLNPAIRSHPLPSGLNQHVLRLATFWLGATLLLWVGPTAFAAADWVTRLVYFMVGANCLVLLAGLVAWHRVTAGSLAQHPSLPQSFGKVLVTASEVMAVVLMTVALNQLLL